MANSLTNYEVSIVKNLIDNPDFKNQEIAGLINRYRGDAKSDVSSGRISNIKNNQIQKYEAIAACTDQVVKDFLEKVEALKLGVGPVDSSPISDFSLGKLFPLKSSDSLRLNITETDQIECKESFNMVMKTIASFANNKGGYFAFGVKNKTWEVIGLNPTKLKKFEEFDLKDINQKIRTALGADLQVQKRSYSLGEKTIGIMYIAEGKIKPLIFTKSDGNSGYAEGHIYYRYPGEDRLIAPLDLQQIIEDRIRDLSKTILTKHISQILDAGPTNAAVLNMNTGEVDGASGKFVIDKSLLKDIEFIKEGQFKENSGAPTLKLIGKLQATNQVQTEKVLDNISKDDLISCFLHQDRVNNPSAFINALRDIQTLWLPIFYYQRLAQLSDEQAIACLKKGIGGMKSSISKHTARLKDRTGPALNAYGSEEYRLAIKDCIDLDVENMELKNQRLLLRSIQEIRKNDVELKYILSLLQKFYPSIFINSSESLQSEIRKAICSVDATFFA